MGLRLVDYDPNDYKLSTVLSSGAGEILTSQEHLSSAFSLFFHWAKESQCWVRFNKDGSRASQCSLTRDEEERELTQIFFSIPVSDMGTEKFYENLFVRMVVFDTCFEFEAEIIDAWIEHDQQWLITQVPSSIKALRARKSPRAQAHECNIVFNWDGKSQFKELKALSVGLNSIVTDAQIPVKEEGQVTIDGTSFRAKCMRADETSSCLEILFQNDFEAGVFFETYAKIKYPLLRNRRQFPISDVIDLYERSGFFSNFQGSFDESDKLSQIQKTWEGLHSVDHQYTADFCITKDQRLAGASSLGLCLKSLDLDYWVFQQLCCDKDLGTYDDTGDLYSWRAEYLFAKKSKLASIFWFRSSSRWLERIYVKYLLQNPTFGELRQGNAYSYIHEADGEHSNEVELVNFGDENRAYLQNRSLVAGAGPDYVHANRNMNIIYSKDGDWQAIHQAANSICRALDKKSMYFRVDLPPGISPPESARTEHQGGSDRFARINREGMLDLVSCIRHSIAITKHKKGVA